MSFSCAKNRAHASFVAAIDASKYVARSAPATASISLELTHTMSSRKKSLLVTTTDVGEELQQVISPPMSVG